MNRIEDDNVVRKLALGGSSIIEAEQVFLL
jgi:hypothetical protein